MGREQLRMAMRAMVPNIDRVRQSIRRDSTTEAATNDEGEPNAEGNAGDQEIAGAAEPVQAAKTDARESMEDASVT